jgi:hypothetical protein
MLRIMLRIMLCILFLILFIRLHRGDGQKLREAIAGLPLADFDGWGAPSSVGIGAASLWRCNAVHGAFLSLVSFKYCGHAVTM